MMITIDFSEIRNFLIIISILCGFVGSVAVLFWRVRRVEMTVNGEMARKDDLSDVKDMLSAFIRENHDDHIQNNNAHKDILLAIHHLKM
jgi:hypothetical protein